MTSKIIVNNIESDSGISSITFNDDILVGDINSTGTSTFNVISGVSTIGVTTAHVVSLNSTSLPNVGALGYRNLLINGGMKISERGLTTSFTTSGSADNYTLDRWQVNGYQCDEDQKAIDAVYKELEGTIDKYYEKVEKAQSKQPDMEW